MAKFRRFGYFLKLLAKFFFTKIAIKNGEIFGEIFSKIFGNIQVTLCTKKHHFRSKVALRRSAHQRINQGTLLDQCLCRTPPSWLREAGFLNAKVAP